MTKIRRNPLQTSGDVSLALDPITSQTETPLLYDYSQVDERHRAAVILAARRIKVQAEKTRQSILAIGKELTEVKQRLPHGQFGEWLTQEFSMSDRMARHLMQVYEVYGAKTETVSVLSDSVLILLAGSSVPETARQQAADEARTTGKSPTKRRTQAIIDQHKPPPRPLTLDETIAVVWRTLRTHTGALARSDPAVRLAWLQTATANDFQAALKPNVTLDVAQLTHARQTVARELQDELKHVQRTAECQPPSTTAQNGLHPAQPSNLPASPPTQPTAPPASASEPAVRHAELLAVWQTAYQTLDELDTLFHRHTPAIVRDWIDRTLKTLQEQMTSTE